MEGTRGGHRTGAPLNAHARPMPPSEERRRGSLGSRLLAALGQPRGLGVAVAAVGAIGIASSLTPALPQRLELVEDLVDPLVLHLAAGTTALIGIILMLLGRGLARRRRGAHVAALALLGVSAVLHLVKGLDVEEAMLAAGVFVLLVRSRREFTVPMPAGRALVVVRVALILAVIDLGFGLAGLAIGAGRLRVPFKPGRALAEVVRRLGGANGAIHFHGVARLFPLTLAVLGFVSVGALLVSRVRPGPRSTRPRQRADSGAGADDDESRGRRHARSVRIACRKAVCVLA